MDPLYSSDELMDDSDEIRIAHEGAVYRLRRTANGKLIPTNASIASSAPFVGLFGTVWGIYHALLEVASSGQSSLDRGHQHGAFDRRHAGGDHAAAYARGQGGPAERHEHTARGQDGKSILVVSALARRPIEEIAQAGARWSQGSGCRPDWARVRPRPSSPAARCSSVIAAQA